MIRHSYNQWRISPSSWASLPPHTPPGHHRAPSWAPCVIERLPTRCLFHTWSRICVSVTLSVHPTLSFSYYAHTSLPYVCISIPALQRGPSVPLRVKFSPGKTTTLVAFCSLDYQASWNLYALPGYGEAETGTGGRSQGLRTTPALLWKVRDIFSFCLFVCLLVGLLSWWLLSSGASALYKSVCTALACVFAVHSCLIL